MKFKKIVSVLLLFSLCLGPVLPPVSASAESFRSFEKEPGHLADAIQRGVDSNVLIFIDMTNPMVMSLAGQLPIFRWQMTPQGMLTMNPDDVWMQANQPMMRDGNFRASLMAQNTFGTGSRPVSHATTADQADRLNNTNPPTGRMFVPPFTGTELPNLGPMGGMIPNGGTRWGRHVNAHNNVIGHPNHFYSPDPDRPFLLTFRNPVWANLPLGAPFPPDLVTAIGNQFLPTMNAAGVITAFGQPVPLNIANEHLVPNDSKMYKLKLVLWRLLEPHPDNVHMLSRMRLGLATTFFEHFADQMGRPGTFFASIQQPPFSAGLANVFHPNASNVLMPTMINHPYGRAEGAVQGVVGQTPPNLSIVTFFGVLSSYRMTAHGLRHAGRSILRVPFDFMYTRGADGNFAPTRAVIAFRELIDGIEQLDTAPVMNMPFETRFVNSELMPTALIHTAERKMFGRGNRGDEWLTNAVDVPHSVRHMGSAPGVIGFPNAVLYNAGPRDSRVTLRSMENPNIGLIMDRIETSEEFMSGTVVGDVLDFFSPNPQVLPFQAGADDGSGDTRGFFPVTGSCQQNWIIYFSTGSENFPGWTGCDQEVGANRSMMRTLMDIYYSSQTLRGRTWDGLQWQEAVHHMDDPIRTIVVGLVSTENMVDMNGNCLDGDPFDRAADASNPTYRRLRNSIRRMAQAGQPIATRNAQGEIISLDPNPTIEPIFAENTEELIAALHAALSSIQSGSLSAGAPLPREVEGVDEFPVMFSASYEIEQGRQWRGSLTKRVLQPVGYDPPSLPAPLWMAHGGGPRADAGAIMYTQRATRGARLFTTDENGFTVPLQGMDAGQIADLFGIPPQHASPAVPEEFKNWLINYSGDYSGILGDMENSAPRIVIETPMHRIIRNPYPMPPTLPPMRLYLQTNRGVLHSLDYETGQEVWAFIPPLARNPFMRDKRFTGGGNVFLTQEMDLRSRAMRILDGMLVHREVINSSGVPSTFLMGTMGLAGAGFYMMDITDRTTAVPQFLWAIANPRYEAPTSLSDIQRWGTASGANPANFVNYADLGFTIAAPAMHRIGASGLFQYVGILPGGLGYNMGVNNDSQGRAFFVFNIHNGGIIRTIGPSNPGSFIPPPNVPAAEGRMGMGIAPLYLVRNHDGTLREFFTGDSEGNILRSGILYGLTPDGPANVNVNDWTLRSVFRVRNMESGGAHGLGGPIALPLSYAIVSRAASGARPAQRWLFAGTSNVTAPERRELTNDEQYIFALNLLNHPAFNDSQLMPVHTPRTLADLGAIRREHDTTDLLDPVDNSASAAVFNAGPNNYGWRLRLRPRVPDLNEPREAEYVSVTPILHNGVLYVATFTPHAWSLGGDRERCTATGDGRLYALDPATGASMWRSGAQSLRFRDVKIVGISTFRGNLFIGVEERVAGATARAFGLHTDTADAIMHGEGVGEIVNPPGNDPPIDPDWEFFVPHMQFWREEIIR